MSRSKSRQRPPVDPYTSARQFYETRLADNPTMPRYNHLLGAMCAEKGEHALAENYFRNTITVTPNDIMVRNDFALLLAKQNRKEDALQEFKKATLVTEDSALLQKNIGAVQGNSGKYKEALESATRSRHLYPDDAMNHRNIAKLHSALGDTRSALKHNMTSIYLENPGYERPRQPVVTSAAAVQIIASGGNRSEAFKLMDIARTLENKTVTLDTTQRTNEIIYKAMKRMGNQAAILEQQKKEEEAKKAVAEIQFADRSAIMNFAMRRAQQAEQDELAEQEGGGGEGGEGGRRRRRKPKGEQEDS